MSGVRWHNDSPLPTRTWTCSYCGKATGNDKGFSDKEMGRCIYICPSCSCPTYFEGNKQVPGAPYGNSVENLPQEIGPLYEDARNCMRVYAFTSAVLTCRKILMHVAVEKGAPKDKNFAFYVDSLVNGTILPTNFKSWVDKIRQRSNEANHEIIVMSLDDAKNILNFTEMLLKLLYEYPALMS